MAATGTLAGVNALLGELDKLVGRRTSARLEAYAAGPSREELLAYRAAVLADSLRICKGGRVE